MSRAPETASPPAEVDAATLSRWLEGGQALLIDVREPDEHARERIAGARNVPLARVESAPGASRQPSGSTVDIPVGSLPGAAVEYLRARRELKLQETLLESMLRQFEIAKLDEAKEGPVLQQVDVALPPDRKSKPSRAMIVLASVLAAFVLAAAGVVWRRWAALRRETDPESHAAWQRMRRAWGWKRA